MSLLNRLRNAWGAMTREGQESTRGAELDAMIDAAMRKAQETPREQSERPRRHHYNFAYKALPGLAFADPHLPLGFASVTFSWAKLQTLLVAPNPFGREAPNLKIAEFWDYVGAKLPVEERISHVGLAAIGGEFGPEHVMVLIRMPEPLRTTEAYFVVIVYPKSWLNEPRAYENSMPDLRCYVLAKSDVPGKGDASGASLRLVKRDRHGAISFDVPTSPRAFLNEVQISMRNPDRWIASVESPTWHFLMQDAEAGQTYGAD